MTSGLCTGTDKPFLRKEGKHLKNNSSSNNARGQWTNCHSGIFFFFLIFPPKGCDIETAMFILATRCYESNKDVTKCTITISQFGGIFSFILTIMPLITFQLLKCS